jgi:hypothetical protein
MSGAGDLTNGNGERRAQLEQRAEAVRTRLERRLDALDDRRDRVVELAKKAAHPPVSIALLGTAAVLGAAIVAYQIHKRPSRTQRVGASLLGVPASKPEGFLMKAFKRGALAFVATLVQRVSSRGLDRLLPEEPPRRLEVPRPRAY